MVTTDEQLRRLAAEERRLAGARDEAKRVITAAILDGQSASEHYTPAAFHSYLKLTMSLDSLEDWLGGISTPADDRFYRAWAGRFGKSAADAIRLLRKEWEDVDGEWRSVRAKLKKLGVDITTLSSDTSTVTMNDKYVEQPQVPYDYQMVMSLSRYESGQVPVEQYSFRLVRALAGEVAEVTIGINHERWALPSFFIGGTPKYVRTSKTHSNAVVRLSPPLQSGDHRAIAFSQRIDTDEPATFRMWTPGAPVELLVIGVQFADTRPARIWWFDQLQQAHAPGPYLEDNNLQISDDGYVEHQFHNVHGKSCGLGWEWE